jgi:glutamate synthase domain-containing protein 3
MAEIIEERVQPVKIDASGVYYQDLNRQIKALAEQGVRRVELQNVCGQRYIGTGLARAIEIDIYGTPGNDLGMLMNGSLIAVHGHAQDGCGNTMNEGTIVIHGHAGDVPLLSARGGNVFVRDDVGYRAGIHMKEYGEKKPVLVVGGTAQDFCGEYMAGGILLLLGLCLKEGERHVCNFVGTGMHAGVIFIRGEIDDFRLGREVGVLPPDGRDMEVIAKYVARYTGYFGGAPGEIMKGKFIKLFPKYLRPYGTLYAY